MRLSTGERIVCAVVGLAACGFFVLFVGLFLRDIGYPDLGETLVRWVGVAAKASVLLGTAAIGVGALWSAVKRRVN